MAGLIPGITLGIVLMIQVYIISVRRGYPKGEKYKFKEAIKISLESSAGLFTVILIMGGVFSGIVTANESAVIACIWAFFIALFVYKGITIRDVWPILRRVLGTLAMVMTLIAASSAFGYMMTILHIPSLISEGLLTVSDNKYVLLLLINIALLFLGTIMDMAPLILLCAPILMPVVTGPVIGLDPIHFGIVLLFNLSIGLLTPPVGTAIFVGSGISGLKIEVIAKALLPFYCTMILTLLLLTYVPALSMTIPNIMFGN
jgi:tripartite ATP-independent transporter DctM subunit